MPLCRALPVFSRASLRRLDFHRPPLILQLFPPNARSCTDKATRGFLPYIQIGSGRPRDLAPMRRNGITHPSPLTLTRWRIRNFLLVSCPSHVVPHERRPNFLGGTRSAIPLDGVIGGMSAMAGVPLSACPLNSRIRSWIEGPTYYIYWAVS